MALTLPLTFCTLMIWLIANAREKTKAEMKRLRYYVEREKSSHA